jgi:hypothetical protein
MSRDKSTRLVPDRIVANHRAQIGRLVMLELSNGTTLGVSARQPLVLHDGELLRARDIAKRVDVLNKTKKHRSREPVRLRNLSGAAIRVISSRIVKGKHSVYWLETAEKRNISAGGIESTTDFRLKTVLPPS